MLDKNKIVKAYAYGDNTFIAELYKQNYKHDKLDRLDFLNDMYAWDNSWEDNTEIEYIEIKLSIFKDLDILEEIERVL